MNITVKILNERERARHIEPWKMLFSYVRCAIVLTSFFTISNKSSSSREKTLDSLPRIYTNLILHCSFFRSSTIWPASQYCVSMGSFPFLQTITTRIELIAHVSKIEHAIEAEANHDQVHLVVYVRVCVAMYNDDLLMINRIRNTSAALAKRNQTHRCNAFIMIMIVFHSIFCCCLQFAWLTRANWIEKYLLAIVNVMEDTVWVYTANLH